MIVKAQVDPQTREVIIGNSRFGTVILANPIFGDGYVEGEIVETNDRKILPRSDRFRRAYYNPNMVETYVDKQDGTEIHGAKAAYLCGNSVFYV